MIYIFFLLSSIFAQDVVSGCMELQGYSACTSPAPILDSSEGIGSGGSYKQTRENIERLVAREEQERANFSRNHMQSEGRRIERAEIEAKKNLMNSAMKMLSANNFKDRSIDQFRVYVDSSESLSKKFDSYKYNISDFRKNYFEAVKVGESIVYSNISSSYPVGFNSSGIFIPEVIESKMPKSPFSDFRPEGLATTQHGQIVRRVANQYQAHWGENSFYILRSHQSMAQLHLGASFVRLADQSFESSPMESFAYLEIAQTILDFSKGVAVGVYSNAEAIVKISPKLGAALIEFAKASYGDPSKISSSMLKLVMSTPKFAAAFADHISDQYEVLKNGSAREKGEVVGEYLLDVIGAVSTGGATAISSGVKSGSVAGAKVLAKEVGEEILTNPGLQKIVTKEIIPAVEEALEIKSVLNGVSKNDQIAALELNQSLKSTGKVTITKDSLEYTAKIPLSNGSEWNHSVLIKDLHKVSIRSAEEVNSFQKAQFESNPLNLGKPYQDSYKSNTKVFKFVTSTEINDRFVRVYSNPKKMSERWILEKSAIEGLTREQIKDKFALPRIPDYIVDVHIPVGTPMQAGVPNAVFESSGKMVAKQYEILKDEMSSAVDYESFFKKPRKLP